MSDEHQKIIREFHSAGQGQVFRFWEAISPEEQESLISEAREIDLAEIAHLNETLVKSSSGGHVDLAGLEPAPCVALPEHGGDEIAWAEAKLTGEKALRDGKVAAFTVAGGQGTRLGFPGPKGTYPVTPVRSHPLFQVFAEKLLAAQARYDCELMWFLMTSHANHEDTVAFFEKNAFFGLKEEQLHFFRQGRMPAVDYDGKILLSAPHSIAMSPDGHGGALRALVRSGAVNRMELAGVEVLSYFQVDNPLVHCIDPAFIGFHLQTGSEMSSRMVPKVDEAEKVGNFCVKNGRLVVIEYSDMPETLATMRDEAGELLYRAGSIAIHLLSREFVRRMGEGTSDVVLPFHRADKKIPTLDEEGNPAKPDKPNGIKFEMFVFDALPFAQYPVVVETKRSDEFSPVKNPTGVDSAESCRRDQLKQFARWMNASGIAVPVDNTGTPTIAIEVSPTFATDEDSFADSWGALDPKPEIADGLVLA